MKNPLTKLVLKTSKDGEPLQDYFHYRLTIKEYIMFTLQGALIIFLLGILFYQSLLSVILLSPIFPFYWKRMMKKRIERQKWRLNLEFKEGISALSAALEAGYSAEHAFEEACRDLERTSQDNTLILKEFRYIVNQLRMNIPVERALCDFSDRTGIEDIISFSEVFSTAKRTGGDLINVIRITNRIISDKIEVKREIKTLIMAKHLEANIMKLIPLFILIYLSAFSPGFLDPLYHNLFGIVIMTVFLLIYLGAFLLIDRIVSIEI